MANYAVITREQYFFATLQTYRWLCFHQIKRTNCINWCHQLIVFFFQKELQFSFFPPHNSSKQRESFRRKWAKAFFSFLARCAQKTKEVGPRLLVGGQRIRPCPSCGAAQPGGQRSPSDACCSEDRCQDRDTAQRVRGHHHHRGVHRSGRFWSENVAAIKMGLGWKRGRKKTTPSHGIWRERRVLHHGIAFWFFHMWLHSVYVYIYI